MIAFLGHSLQRKTEINKKIFLRERKRHTACCVTSTRSGGRGEGALDGGPIGTAWGSASLEGTWDQCMEVLWDGDGVAPPPHVNRQTPVKTVSFPFLWNAGGKYCEVCLFTNFRVYICVCRKRTLDFFETNHLNDHRRRPLSGTNMHSYCITIMQVKLKIFSESP